MEDIQNILNDINGLYYKKLSEIETGKKFKVVSIEIVKTVFGKRVCIKCEEFKFLLPESWVERFSEKNIKAVNKTDLYVEYRGLIDLSNGKSKHDIVFSQ